MDTTAGDAPRSTPRPVEKPRLVALDVLRGVALCGILLVNIEPVTRFGYDLPPSPVTLDDPSGWLQLLVQQRFFPIFSLLFGVGFALLVDSAGRVGVRPQLVLARRLLVLLPVGLAHQLLHPGEALAVYALVGLVVLLPASWLPRWVTAAGAAVLIPASFVLTGGGISLVPGVFLLGSALVRYGLLSRIAGSWRPAALLLLVSAVASVPAILVQLGDLTSPGFDTASGVAGVLMAGAYTGAVLLVLHTPLRPVLVAVFAPLGRMALTNYLVATLLMVSAGRLVAFPDTRSWAPVFLLAATILVVQWTYSTLWLLHYRQGPLEWLWRWATWGRRPELRTAGAGGAVRATVSAGGVGGPLVR